MDISKNHACWKKFLAEGENLEFSNLATKMMRKRCLMLIKLNPGDDSKIDEAKSIAIEFFNANAGPAVEKDLQQLKAA